MITFYDWNFKIIENDLTSFDFIFICNNNQLVMIFFFSLKEMAYIFDSRDANWLDSG